MREQGPRAQPVHLHIAEIPVEGQLMWQIDSHHVLISAQLLGDKETYRRRITPIVQALM